MRIPARPQGTPPVRPPNSGLGVYLAGKIGRGDWRHAVVDGLHDVCVGGFDDDDRFNWPRMPRAVFGRFDYVGPYFAELGGHGAGHGPDSHGIGVDQGHDDGRDRVRCAAGCLAALERADVFFAWLDDPTAYGTLIEIGYALSSKATRKKPGRVVVARPPRTTVAFEDYVGAEALERADEEDAANGGHGYGWARIALEEGYDRWRRRDDLWFASALPGAEHVRGPDPVTVLRSLLDPVAFESPAEERFWVAWHAAQGPRLEKQHKVLGGKYKLDFAHLASRTAIEVDGLAYHNGQEAFQRDHARQRRLTELGWRVVRFTAKEVLADAARCVREAIALCAAGGSAEPFPPLRRPLRLGITVDSNGSNGSNSGSNGSNSGSNGSNSGSNG